VSCPFTCNVVDFLDVTCNFTLLLFVLVTFALQSNFKAPAYWVTANKLIPLSLSLALLKRNCRSGNTILAMFVMSSWQHPCDHGPFIERPAAGRDRARYIRAASPAEQHSMAEPTYRESSY